MDLETVGLFFFSALGAFNGLIISIYFLFFAKPRHISNYFLGGLILALSIRIGKSVFFYFNEDLSYGYLQFGLTGCFFIGPFLYFYVKSVINSDGWIKKEWMYHLAILVPLVLFITIKFPFATNIDFWEYHVIHRIYYVWLAYLLLAGFTLIPLIKKFFIRDNKLRSIEIWVLTIFIGNVIIWCAYYFAGMTSYILGALLFSFMLYLSLLIIFFKRKNNSILLADQPKYKDKKIEAPRASDLLGKLKNLMEKEELYKNPDLKLADVAKKLNVLPHTVSQLLNDNVGVGFPKFLNEYRIEEAKKQLLLNDNLTLESIGYDCGFNSKSTFYAAFKKITGTTPSKFKESSNS